MNSKDSRWCKVDFTLKDAEVKPLRHRTNSDDQTATVFRFPFPSTLPWVPQ